jgi:hypothetical protein
VGKIAIDVTFFSLFVHGIPGEPGSVKHDGIHGKIKYIKILDLSLFLENLDQFETLIDSRNCV